MPILTGEYKILFTSSGPSVLICTILATTGRLLQKVHGLTNLTLRGKILITLQAICSPTSSTRLNIRIEVVTLRASEALGLCSL
jgi:hypothetical protein